MSRGSPGRRWARVCSRGLGLALCRFRLRRELKDMGHPTTVQPCLIFRCTAS